jgi:hypothetical protein
MQLAPASSEYTERGEEHVEVLINSTSASRVDVPILSELAARLNGLLKNSSQWEERADPSLRSG